MKTKCGHIKAKSRARSQSTQHEIKQIFKEEGMQEGPDFIQGFKFKGEARWQLRANKPSCMHGE